MQLASVAFTLLVTMCTLLNHIIMIIVIIRTYSQNINFVEITVYCQKNNVSYAGKMKSVLSVFVHHTVHALQLTM